MEIEKNRRKQDLGGSLPVDKVQSLASKKLNDIPLRYIRPDVEVDYEVSPDDSLQVPVIDMGKLVISQLGYEDELAELHSACKDWGFFQLINHGILESIEKMKEVTEEFFKLTLEQKMESGQEPNNLEGYGQAFVVSEDQKLDWGDMLYLRPMPLRQRDLRFWPKNPTSFRSTLDEYSAQLHSVSIRLLKLMARNLGVEEEKLSSLFEECAQGIRMNYYPPCPHANKVLGIAPHSDATGLTLLIQINQVQGLQIRKNSKWIPINPIPGAIIINIGDVMDIMSNGEYSSIEHRAVVDYNKERLSIAGFHSVNFDAMIGPLPELVKDKRAKYKTISNEEYMKMSVSSKLDGKSLLDHMRIDP